MREPAMPTFGEIVVCLLIIVVGAVPFALGMVIGLMWFCAEAGKDFADDKMAAFATKAIARRDERRSRSDSAIPGVG